MTINILHLSYELPVMQNKVFLEEWCGLSVSKCMKTDQIKIFIWLGIMLQYLLTRHTVNE